MRVQASFSPLDEALAQTVKDEALWNLPCLILHLVSHLHVMHPICKHIPNRHKCLHPSAVYISQPILQLGHTITSALTPPRPPVPSSRTCPASTRQLLPLGEMAGCRLDWPSRVPRGRSYCNSEASRSSGRQWPSGLLLHKMVACRTDSCGLPSGIRREMEQRKRPTLDVHESSSPLLGVGYI